ncbi:unnamed protein product [Boreogadus saida]
MIRPSLDPADVFSWRLCWDKGPALYLAFPRGSAFKTFQTFQKGPALYLAFPRGSAFKTFQTFQKGPAFYLAFVFADAGHLWVFAVARLQNFFCSLLLAPLHPPYLDLTLFFCMSWVAW